MTILSMDFRVKDTRLDHGSVNAIVLKETDLSPLFLEISQKGVLEYARPA